MRRRDQAHLVRKSGIETSLQFGLSGGVGKMHPCLNRFPDEHQSDPAWVCIVKPYLFGQKWNVVIGITDGGAVVRLAEGPHLVIESAECGHMGGVHLEHQNLNR